MCRGFFSWFFKKLYQNFKFLLTILPFSEFENSQDRRPRPTTKTSSASRVGHFQPHTAFLYCFLTFFIRFNILSFLSVFSMDGYTFAFGLDFWSFGFSIRKMSMLWVLRIFWLVIICGVFWKNFSDDCELLSYEWNFGSERREVFVSWVRSKVWLYF